MPQRYRAIFESAVDFAIIATDREGLVTDWNPGAERVLGWSAEEMREHSAERFFTPEDRAAGRVAAEMALALSQGRASDERWHLKKDGTRFFAVGEMTPLRDEAGEHLGFLKILTDRTGEREARTALSASEVDLHRAQEAGGVGLFSLDIASNTMRVTPEFCRLFGLPEHSVYPAATIEALFLRDGGGTEHSTRETRRDGSLKLDVEYPIRRPDTGEVHWIARKAEIERDAAGAPVRVVGVVQDVTGRRRVEEQLRDLNASLETRVAERTADRNALWQLSSDLMLRCTFEGVMTAVNPAWTAMLGWTEGELLGSNLFDLIHPDDLAHTVAGAHELSEGVGHARFDNRYRHRDGSYRWISWTTRPAEGLINAVGRDVTAEKAAATELALAQEQLRQSQKMEAMGQLTGGVAHDFNNLLTPIIGSLDRLVARAVGSERERRLMAGALESAERAKTLVQRLLAFARRQPLQPVAVDVAALVQGMRGLLGSTLGPRIDLRVEPASDLPPARADAHQLEMALLNLAVNARDAMPEGGTLSIRTTRESVRSLSDVAGMPLGLKRGHYVRLAVADTGSGMDAATLERAVEPFFSTKGIGKGTGLGLSMVHGLAAQLGGGLSLASDPGQGTTIALWLPISALAAGATTADAALSGPEPGARGRALLVDDEDLVRMSTADMLEDLGFEVVEASSAEEALVTVRGDESLSVLLTDHLMPGMNGVDLVHQARVLRPGLPALIVSGYAEVEGIDPDLPRLVKPFRAAELKASLAAMLEGKAVPERRASQAS